MSSPPPPFLFFRKRCVGAYVPPAAHCYLSSKRKRLQFLLDVFLCLFSFCSFQWNQKRKKQVSTCGYMRVRLCACVCVRCVWLYVYLCGSRRCAAVREPEVKRTQAVSYKLSNRCLELLIFGFTPCCISTMGKVFIRMGKGVTCGVLIITRLWCTLTLQSISESFCYRTWRFWTQVVRHQTARNVLKIKLY